MNAARRGGGALLELAHVFLIALALLLLRVSSAGLRVVPSGADRYAIRTRNLQDWNLTRYRCANRSLDECASGGVRTHASGEIGA